jgi:polyisoprenoid-binding protein YceI
MSVRWLGGMMVRGRFTDVSGVIHLPTDDDDTVAVTVEIRADSVRTGISLRDRHLRGP